MEQIAIISGILDELYAIRIALSAIYCRGAKIKQNNEGVTAAKKAIDEARSLRDQYPEKTSKREADRIENMYPYSTKYNANSRFFSIRFLSICIKLLGLLGGAFLTYLYYLRHWYEILGIYFADAGEWGVGGYLATGLLLGVSGLVTLVLPAFLFFKLGNGVNSRLNRRIGIRRQEADRSRVDAKRKYAYQTAMSSATYKNEIANLTLRQNTVINAHQKKLDDAVQENNRLLREADEIRSGLVQSFSGIIKPVDWKYVDLLIYYFETGRVSNIKEALLLLESQIQTNQIVNSITSGSKYISENIAKMSKQINQRFDHNDQRLDTLAQNIATVQNGISKASSQIDALKEQNAALSRDLITAQYISSAELAHALDQDLKVKVVN